MPVSNESTRSAATPESATQLAKVELGLKVLMAYHNPKKYVVAEPDVEAEPALATTAWFDFTAIADEDIGFRLLSVGLILSAAVLILGDDVGMEWIIGIVIMIPAFALGLLTLMFFGWVFSFIFMMLGEWIFRLFWGRIICRHYCLGDRCSRVAKGDVDHRRTNRHAAHAQKYRLGTAVNSVSHLRARWSGTCRLAISAV
jgi:hypothetical protein